MNDLIRQPIILREHYRWEICFNTLVCANTATDIFRSEGYLVNIVGKSVMTNASEEIIRKVLDEKFLHSCWIRLVP